MLTFPELARVTAMTAVAHGPRRTRQRRRTRPRAAEGSAGPCAGAGVACAPASHPVPAASSAPLSPASGHTHASPGQTWVKGQEARKEQDSGPQPLSLPVPVDPRADLREPSRPGFTSSAFSGHQASLTPVPTQGELRISVLPAYLSYDAPWPVRKIPLRCTAHYVAYHVESKVCPHLAGTLGTGPRGVQGLPPLGQELLGLGWALAPDILLSPRCTPSPPAPAHLARAFHA